MIKKSFKLNFLYFICNSNSVNTMIDVFKFGLLRIWESNSKAVYRLNDRYLKHVSINAITLNQNLNGFMATPITQIRI